MRPSLAKACAAKGKVAERATKDRRVISMAHTWYSGRGTISSRRPAVALCRKLQGGGLRQNRKGRDIGYALVASSCEGANNVEACTVTTPDAITAFAVPNPNCSSQNQSAFSGSAAARVASLSESPSLLRISNCLFSLTLSTVDNVKLTRQSEMSTPGNCAMKIS